MPFSPIPARTWWWLYSAAALSLFTTLLLPYVGEEAVYTITSLEMRLNGDFFMTTLYGTNYGRPPLMTWLTIPLAEFFGWNRMLTATRLITVASTIATGLVLAWLAFNLTRNRAFAALSAAVFLSGDVLLYRGWLAYADPLFTLFVFSAIACLWVGARRGQTSLLWLAAVLVTCGFLTKVQTAYLFYAVAYGALLLDDDTRRRLLAPRAIAAPFFGVAALVAWNAWLTQGQQASGTAVDVLLKLRKIDIGDYAFQLWSFPIETALRFLPASAIAAYYAWRARSDPLTGNRSLAFPWRVLIVMTVANWLPYWLGPNSHIRYIMPLYPLIALIIAALLWRLGERPLATAVRWLAVAVALRFVLGLWGLPWYEETYRGDYPAVAAQVAEAVRGFPLYTTDVSATGLSVAAHLDAARFPEPYLHWPPDEWTDGFVLSYSADPKLGDVYARYALGNNELFLLCRGVACRKDARK